MKYTTAWSFLKIIFVKYTNVDLGLQTKSYFEYELTISLKFP